MIATRCRKPAERLVNVSKPINGVRAMKIVQDGQACGYYLKPIPADFGVAFELEKFTGNTGTDETERVYRLAVDGERSACSCKGHARWNHCRHVEAVCALLKNGRI